MLFVHLSTDNWFLCHYEHNTHTHTRSDTKKAFEECSVLNQWEKSYCTRFFAITLADNEFMRTIIAHVDGIFLFKQISWAHYGTDCSSAINPRKLKEFEGF